MGTGAYLGGWYNDDRSFHHFKVVYYRIRYSEPWIEFTPDEWTEFVTWKAEGTRPSRELGKQLDVKPDDIDVGEQITLSKSRLSRIVDGIGSGYGETLRETWAMELTWIRQSKYHDLMQANSREEKEKIAARHGLTLGPERPPSPTSPATILGWLLLLVAGVIYFLHSYS
jgi:hypothetical protein